MKETTNSLKYSNFGIKFAEKIKISVIVMVGDIIVDELINKLIELKIQNF